LLLRGQANSRNPALRAARKLAGPGFMISSGRIPADGDAFAQVSALINKIKHKC